MVTGVLLLVAAELGNLAVDCYLHGIRIGRRSEYSAGSDGQEGENGSDCELHGDVIREFRLVKIDEEWMVGIPR
jgi:hypothetical protein